MEIKDSDIFVVGYGGWVLLKREHSGENYQNHQSSVPSLSGTLLQVTSASVTRTTQVPTLNSYYLPFLESDTAKSPIRVGPNLYTFSGELSFEVTDGVLDELLVLGGVLRWSEYGGDVELRMVFGIHNLWGEQHCDHEHVLSKQQWIS